MSDFASREFLIDVNTEPFVKRANKVHRPTRVKVKDLYNEVVEKLRGDGVWPA